MQSSDLICVVFKRLSLTVRSEIPGTDKKVRTSVRKSSSIFQKDTQNGMWGLHLNRKLRNRRNQSDAALSLGAAETSLPPRMQADSQQKEPASSDAER